jgi:hypothetical protein
MTSFVLASCHGSIPRLLFFRGEFCTADFSYFWQIWVSTRRIE